MKTQLTGHWSRNCSFRFFSKHGRKTKWRQKKSLPPTHPLKKKFSCSVRGTAPQNQQAKFKAEYKVAATVLQNYSIKNYLSSPL